MSTAHWRVFTRRTKVCYTIQNAATIYPETEDFSPLGFGVEGPNSDLSSAKTDHVSRNCHRETRSRYPDLIEVVAHYGLLCAVRYLRKRWSLPSVGARISCADSTVPQHPWGPPSATDAMVSNYRPLDEVLAGVRGNMRR
jgi:hypothetical protein